MFAYFCNSWHYHTFTLSFDRPLFHTNIVIDHYPNLLSFFIFIAVTHSSSTNSSVSSHSSQHPSSHSHPTSHPTSHSQLTSGGSWAAANSTSAATHPALHSPYSTIFPSASALQHAATAPVGHGQIKTSHAKATSHSSLFSLNY